MTELPLPANATELERFILDSIPLSRAMQMQLAGYDGQRLTLRAPLAPNANDKGCAFGGSLASLMTLAGWSLVELKLREAGEDCDLFIGNSELRYLAPVWEAISAEAELTEDPDWTRFFATLAQRGRARATIACRVPGAQGAAAEMTARFVAKRRA
ncbi:YiiD C-terminal domain-containing protein [Oleiagrimonas sp. C23AA]|uniref:YiiD C-terminal domain-containing protein n=1 Tax=Oleiagrimonas sp. C23AA TaxID=2719047 RepID=UPI001423DAC4|nr:YiiD C-terminal domain-containing protein [Oleiagrimonas sp. C23AA]NII12324.1 thioesterase [Oleiagrimonas sp. C23AA]